MSAVQIRDLSHTHEAFMNWMLLNPHKSLGEMAATFGYTQSWVSTVIHSDVFQRRLAERHGDLANRVGQTTVEKMQAVADVGLERLMDILPLVTDPTFVRDTTDKMLQRLGYSHKAPPQPGVVVNNTNTFVLSKDKLTGLREVIVNGSAQRVVDNSSAERISAGDRNTLGSICVDASECATEQTGNACTEERNTV